MKRLVAIATVAAGIALGPGFAAAGIDPALETVTTTACQAVPSADDALPAPSWRSNDPSRGTGEQPRTLSASELQAIRLGATSR